jgi:hypothetical protein
MLTEEEFNQLPSYVSFKDGAKTCLRLCFDYESENKLYYYRDAGVWGVEFKRMDDGSIFTTNAYYSGLNNKELLKITEEQWRKDNGGYISDS